MVVAYIGYESGRRALVESIRSQLSGLCQVKSTSIQTQLRTIKGLVVSLSADETSCTPSRTSRRALTS